MTFLDFSVFSGFYSFFYIFEHILQSSSIFYIPHLNLAIEYLFWLTTKAPMGSADNGAMYRKSYVENPENMEFTQKTLLEQLGSDPLAIEDRIRSWLVYDGLDASRIEPKIKTNPAT